MAKAKVKQRKDSKGRVLQKGESQRKLDGMYIYTYVNPYGKRCYVYSKDLFTLREKEQELIKAQMDGLDYYVGGHATINMTFDRYMSTKHNLRETTRSNYLYMFNRFIREDFGNKFLTEVKYTDVKLFYYHLLNEKDIAINTLDTIHTVLHPIFDMAVRDDIIRKNPTDGVLAEIKRNSGKNKGIRHALTIEQQQAFMDTIRTFPEYYHWYPLFATLLGTGMRIGEVCALKWEDVDFAQKTIIVKHTVGRIYNCELKSTERVHSSPKTKNSYREIPISKQLLQALKMVRKQSQSPYVVGTSTQSKEPRSYRDYFGRLLKRLDIPHLVFHGLRHTFATRCIESQCDYKTVSVILGHSNVATTLNLYVHPNLNQKKRCIDRMSNFLGIT